MNLLIELRWAFRESFDISADNYRKTLMRRMVSWLTALSDHCFSGQLCHKSASIALIIVADISVPRSLWSPHVYSQRRKDDT